MKRIIPVMPVIVVMGLFLSSCGPEASRKANDPLEAVPFTRVDITDVFWSPKQEVNRTVSIPQTFKRCEETGLLFNSTAFKVVEGAAYSLARHPDSKLEGFIDDWSDRVIPFLFPGGSDERWRNPKSGDSYQAGHFIEAALAYYQATGKRKLLDAAIRIADCFDAVPEPGKNLLASGHEELKIGLAKLFRLTGEKRHLDLAKFVLDTRGRDYAGRVEKPLKEREYNQDHIPVIEQDRAVGHCVCATYLYAGMTDIAALTGAPEYSIALDRIWEDAVHHKTFITGGIGSIRYKERYGDNYELPNLSCWCETCAAIGNILWNQRMFLLRRDAKYIDLMERALYNGFLVGVSQKGDRFFYQNPLISYGNYERFDWINVPCCPPNVVRLMSSLGDYIYAQTEDAIYVNLFIGSNAEIERDQRRVRIIQETRYPWEGNVKLTIDPEKPGAFTLYIRIPGWARNEPLPGDLYAYMDPTDDKPALKVNGKGIDYRLEKGYARVERRWKSGDTIELDLPMPVHRVQSHRFVRDNKGRVALERGPLVYCAEWADNGGSALNLLINDDTDFRTEFRPDLLNGIEVVTGKILALSRGPNGVSIQTKPHQLTAIPYFAWANRGMGEMAVWIPRRGDRARIKPIYPESIMNVRSFGGIEKSWTGYNDQNDDLSAVYDGWEPLNSADESNLYYRMRPPEGKPAWVEYEFRTPQSISASDVYWVDDRRFCALPESWRLLYRDGTQWKPVSVRGTYGVEKDRFNQVSFDPVKTKAVRLEVVPRKILYKAGTGGPPAALVISEDVDWREFGVIEWRIHSKE